MAKKGQVYGINTSKGVAYFQYHSRNKLMGPLIRVLKGEYTKRPDVSLLVKDETRFWTFLPVDALLRAKTIESCGVFDLPVHAKDFPLFRAGLRDKEGKVSSWWFWDGEKEWQAGDLSEEQKKISIRSILNDTMLIKRIESGWLPENDLR